jgi:predicted aconitase with swiveling domain
VPSALLLALEERDEVPVTVPESLKGKAIWLPTGKGSVTGAKVLSMENGWTKVQPGTDPIMIKTRRS